MLLIGVPILSFSTGLSVPENLVAWWPADNHAYDVVATNPAILQVGADYAPGKVGEAFSLPGGTAKVYINEWPNTDLSGMSEWTIEAWIKPDLANCGTYATIYSELNRTISLGMTPDGYLDSWINSANRLISTDPIDTNDWNHVALVCSGINSRTFYINGVPAGQGTSAMPSWTPYGGSAIGNAVSANPLYAFAGEVDELSLYERALEASEIAAIHASGSSGKYFDDPAPAFIVEPESRTNFLGETISFEAVVMGVPRPTYQWLKDGNPLTGETNLKLVLPNLDFADDGDYQIIAVNSAGSTTSAVATLTVRFCAETPAGLVAWWPGDGSGLDAISNHHGAVWGNVTYPPGVVYNGPAFGFNGSDAYVAVPDDPELSPHVGTNGEMTVEAWIKVPHDAYGVFRVLAKGDAGRWEYSLVISGGEPTWKVWNPDGTVYGSVTAGLIVEGTWHHLVGTMKKGEYVRLYQDGVLQGESTTLTGDTAHNDTPLYIGRRSDGGFFWGSVDEVALYNRALDIGEIAKLYDGGAFGKCFGATNPAPEFVVQPSQQSGYLLLNAGLSAIALGTPRPDYQWYRSVDSEWVELFGQTNATLAFSELGEEDEGYYMVSVSNVHGVADSDPAYLEVIPHDILTSGDSFEKGWNGWTTGNPNVWQVGVPTSGPGSAHSGDSVAATVLSGNYPRYANSQLISPPFVVPDASQNPRLRFWHWFNTYRNGDYGYVEVREYGSGTWVKISSNYDDYSGSWTRALLDLSAYAGKTVQVAFHFYDDGGDTGYSHYTPTLTSGWYIDEVEVETGALEFNNPEGFEGGLGDWSAERGVWQVGSPSSGPGAAYSGSKCLATELGGNYPRYANSRAISAPFVVPDAGENPRLRFWHWFNTYRNGDYGYVEVREYGSSTWVKLSSNYDDYSGGWTRALLDLSAYGGKTVQVAFHFYDDGGDTGYSHYTPTLTSGWYIDEVEVEAGAWEFNNPEGFEGGLGDWSAERGVWQVGSPTYGPAAYSGSGCLATILGNKYPRYADSRAISPAFMVPAAGENPRLRFWHWYSIWGGDQAYVEIREVGSTSWVRISATYDQTSGTWTCALLDLSAYGGKTVQVAFHFYDDGGDTGYSHYTPTLSTGWYIDKVELETGAWEFNNPEGFEGGLGDWSAERGAWQLGNPSSGPGMAHSGNTCLATILGGNYPRYTNSRVISAPFFVPFGNDPHLEFWHWISTWGDKGYVEVREVGSNSWIQISGNYTSTGGDWQQVSVPLNSYGGKNVQIAFHFWDDGGDTGYSHYTPTLSSGWYIDDVFVKQGNISIVPIANQTINEVNSFGLPSTLTFDVNVVGTDPNPCLGFQLIDPPPGANINPITGQFTWTPSELQSSGVYRIPIYVVDYCNNEANDLVVVQITVNEVNEMPSLMPTTGTAFVGLTNFINVIACDPDYPDNALGYSLLDTVPTGLTIDSGTGVLRWAPTADQVGDYELTVQVCDGGSPNYCATNTVSIGVTTNAPTYLAIEEVVEGAFLFTILNGRDDYDYMLQQAFALSVCPCEMTWEDVMLVSPSNAPPQFIYSPLEFESESTMFFRVKEMPRTP